MCGALLAVGSDGELGLADVGAHNETAMGDAGKKVSGGKLDGAGKLADGDGSIDESGEVEDAVVVNGASNGLGFFVVFYQGGNHIVGGGVGKGEGAGDVFAFKKLTILIEVGFGREIVNASHGCGVGGGLVVVFGGGIAIFVAGDKGETKSCQGEKENFFHGDMDFFH